ncbi:YrzI family small protein [Bacillus massiliglaciei]|nr:YrzI family small protein [Bacillus massiliglaciei]
MTLNILFLTITIKKKRLTAEECLHQEEIQRLRDEHLDKAIQNHRFF